MDTDGEIPQKVLSLAGESTILSRITQLMKNAETEVIMCIGEASSFSEPIAETLINTCTRSISTHIGAVNGELAAEIKARIPEAAVSNTEVDEAATGSGWRGDKQSVTSRQSREYSGYTDDCKFV